jgi:hypothetical protein
MLPLPVCWKTGSTRGNAAFGSCSKQPADKDLEFIVPDVNFGPGIHLVPGFSIPSRQRQKRNAMPPSRMRSARSFAVLSPNAAAGSGDYYNFPAILNVSIDSILII